MTETILSLGALVGVAVVAGCERGAPPPESSRIPFPRKTREGMMLAGVIYVMPGIGLRGSQTI